MKFRILAHLVLMVNADNVWQQLNVYDLNQYVIRIGRAKDCEISITIPEFPNLGRAISRYHATLYYYVGESSDYYIQDGLPPDVLKNEESTKLSSLGVYVNNKSYKLEPNEKYLLKNNDEFHLVYDRLKFIYYRQTKTISEKLEDTYIPPEYFL